MSSRYVAIWFRYLKTDWIIRRNPALANMPFVLYEMNHGRMIVSAANFLAEKKGVYAGAILADARATIPALTIQEDPTAIFEDVIQKMAVWFIRYSPVVAVDAPDGIIINATGCAHLWGGEEEYIGHITTRLQQLGYTIKIAMAGSIGAAWALAHFGVGASIVQHGDEKNALAFLPPVALRIDDEIASRLQKLGLTSIIDTLDIPTPSLRRRFGNQFIKQVQFALGYMEELMVPVELPADYVQRLHALEPIKHAKGIEIALQKLIEQLCAQLQAIEKGLRQCTFKAYRIDGKIVNIDINITRPSNNAVHIFKLLASKIVELAPGPGIELFVVESNTVEPMPTAQEEIWNIETNELDNKNIAELMDRIMNKIGPQQVKRFLPAEHYWPELSIKLAASLQEKQTIPWANNKIRPQRLLKCPEPIMVTAPIPDYPPMLFKHKGKLHRIVKADGPERIEQEWWLQQGLHRDYYYVEDEAGNRFWLFRYGHYDVTKKDQWFLHGYCT
jgi:protein ImuB